jgi:8-oxo-dGTP diphosphatase
MEKVDFDPLVNTAQQDGIEKYVVGACIMHEGKILLLKRSLNEKFLPGLIELPSGGIDAGEAMPRALIREVLEETNLTVESIDGLIDSFDYVSHSGKKARQFNFTVTVEDITPIKLNLEEHSEYFWLEPNAHDLAQYNISEHTLATIGKIK